MLAITLWRSGDLSQAEADLVLIKPQAVLIHADPDTLWAFGKARADRVRQLLPGVEIWTGIALDYGWAQKWSVEQLHDRRMRGVHASRIMEATRVVPDPEQAWKSVEGKYRLGFTPSDAKRFVQDAKQVLGPNIPLLITSYDCPTYHGTFPFAAFDAADDWAPQIYAAPEKGDPDPDAQMGKHRLWMHHESWAEAQHTGKLRSRPVTTAYVQLHHVMARETCCIANTFTDAIGWSIPSRCDKEGLLAARVLAELERRGFSGPGRIEAYQRDAGLAPDGLVGPLTLKAMGFDHAQ